MGADERRERRVERAPSTRAPPSGFGRSSTATSSPAAAAAAWTSTLMAMLRAAPAPAPVPPTEAQGIDGRAKEAMGFALLAHDALAGLPTNVPGATGAAHPVTLGSVTPSGGARPRRTPPPSQPR